jgi:uncharacterized membrane protein
MSYYVFLKFLHVLLVVIWLGGGFGLVILAVRADRARADAELAHVVQQVIFMTKVFIPAAFGAFILGITMVLLSWSFSDLWVIIGLLGFALTVGTGILVLKPRSDRIGELISKEGISKAVVEQSRELLQIAKFDFVMLFIVAADMVIKPTADNYVTLSVMAIALVVGAIFFQRRQTANVGLQSSG